MPPRTTGPLAAGKLRTPIVIQVNSTAGTQDSRGEEVETWTTFTTGWAQVDPVPRGSREIEAAQQRQADQRWEIVARFIPNVTPKMRVVAGTHVMDIESVVDPDDRRRRLAMLCVERVAGGTTP